MHKNINVPNIITGLRIISVPVMAFFVFVGNEQAFKWLLLFALLSDIADGVIARTFKLSTELGSFLDALADTAVYFTVLYSLFVFRADFLKAQALPLSVVMGLYILEKIKCFMAYGRPFNSFHNYSAKVTGYLAGIFILSLYFTGYRWYFFYPAVTAGILANIEDMIMTSMLKTYEYDTRGLYWILKRRN